MSDFLALWCPLDCNGTHHVKKFEADVLKFTILPNRVLNTVLSITLACIPCICIGFCGSTDYYELRPNREMTVEKVFACRKEKLLFRGVSGARLVQQASRSQDTGRITYTYKVVVSHDGGTHSLTKGSDNMGMSGKEEVVEAINRMVGGGRLDAGVAQILSMAQGQMMQAQMMQAQMMQAQIMATGGAGMYGGAPGVPPGYLGPGYGMAPGMAPGMYPGMAPGMYPGMAPGMYPGMAPPINPAYNMAPQQQQQPGPVYTAQASAPPSFQADLSGQLGALVGAQDDKSLVQALESLRGFLRSVSPAELTPAVRDQVIAVCSEKRTVSADLWSHGVGVLFGEVLQVFGTPTERSI